MVLLVRRPPAAWFIFRGWYVRPLVRLDGLMTRGAIRLRHDLTLQSPSIQQAAFPILGAPCNALWCCAGRLQSVAYPACNVAHALHMPDALAAHSTYHLSFYKFVHIAQPELCASALRDVTADVFGSILVAHEGINGMVAGEAAALDDFETRLDADARFAGLFGDIVFKRTACRTQPFRRMKVHTRPEILPLGVEGVKIDVPAVSDALHAVSPQDWRKLIEEDDVVLIDNRNSFEYRLGRFRNAIDPQVKNFRDFPRYIEENLPVWKAQGKRVAMYCTGGIRCEKTAAWMIGMDMPVYQLEGGILNYFATMPDAGKDWQGECFVFDNRIALDTHLQETGTRAEDVYAGDPDEQWRLQRARKLAESD